MKYVISVCYLISVLNFALAQTRPSHYIFPDFMKGAVKLRTGTVHEAMLNYNTILESMVIAQPDSKMVMLDGVENVESVLIGSRKFVPFDKQFYELVADAPMPYLVHYTCKVLSPGKTVGFGETSQLTNTSPAAVKQLAVFYYLKLPDEYKVTQQSTIIVEKGGKYLELTSQKKVAELFPEKGQAIKQFVKEHKTDFNSADDVKKLLHFLM